MDQNYREARARVDYSYDPAEDTGEYLDTDNAVWDAAMASLGLHMRCWNLSSCLAVAAGLCRAYELGEDSRDDDDDVIWTRDGATNIVRPTHKPGLGPWFPGCGRGAPHE